MLEFGINVNNDCGKNVEEVIKNIKRAGFKNVMPILKREGDEESLLKVMENGLYVPFVHLSNRDANYFWAKGSKCDEFLEEIKRQIYICGKYHIPVGVLHGTTGSPADIALPPSEVGLEKINELLKVAKECNVKIALENVDAPNFQHFRYLLDNIKSPWLGFCYDVGHHQLYCPEFDIMGHYGDRMIATHLHDNLMDWEYGCDYSQDIHFLPFDGKIDYDQIMENFARANYSNIMMLEVHKDSWSLSRRYDDMGNLEFLMEAKKRAERLVNLLESKKENNLYK